jgi:hypothetical protein
VKIPALLRPPVRPLFAELPTRVVVATGALGYIDAAPDDQARWTQAFRVLLDGLQGPLQVLVRCRTGQHERSGPGEARQRALVPPFESRRHLDLEFARRLRQAGSTQRRDVYLVTTPAAARGLKQALLAMGLPDVHPQRDLVRQYQGCEAPGWWWDDAGLHHTWYVDRFPGGELEPGWLLQLLPPGLDLSLSWHAERLPSAWVVEYMQRQLVQLRAAELSRPDVGDPEVAGAVPAVKELQRQVAARQESAFSVSLYITLSTHGPKELERGSEMIEAAARAALCVLLPCTFRHMEGRVATLPLGVDGLGRGRVCDTSSLVTFFPWFDADLQQDSGIVVGASRATGQPVMIDPFDEQNFANANIGVFGHSGAGKTYLLRTLTMGILSAGAQVYIIDPEHEYGLLAQQLGGVEVKLALGSEHALNVLDLQCGRDEASLGPVLADVVDLCSLLCGELDEPERAAVEEGARRAFQEEEEPVLNDVALRLDQGSRAASVLRRWARGSLGRIFSRPTNINLEASLVVFGMRELRAEMVAPVHFLLAEALWGRIKRRERRRVLVIDELGLLFEEPAIRSFVVALARRIRKYNGSLIFATQNQGDLLSSEAGSVVASNPSIHFFGAQRPGEAAKLQRHFQLSDRQRATLESARRGEFLLAAGANRIPVRVQAPPWQVSIMDPPPSPPN